MTLVFMRMSVAIALLRYTVYLPLPYQLLCWHYPLAFFDPFLLYVS